MNPVIGFSRKIIQTSQKLLPAARGGVYILIYHLIDGGTSSPVDISLQVFRSHLQYLRDQLQVISLQEAITKLADGTAAKSKFAVLTFDDGYLNFYTHAWPLLQEFEIPVTLYIPIDFIEGKAPPPLKTMSELKPCSWRQLQELAASKLVEIGSHTFTHPDLRTIPPASARWEIEESRMKLEEKLQVPVSSFAYPKALWSRSLEELVRRNYRSAVIGGGMRTQPSRWNVHRLSRIPIRKDMPADLGLILESPVWLEERISSMVRPWMHRLRSGTSY
jgi:peptidoglycan/xylan/chitin deacetylase (PgdA/CDA1 family)